MSINRTPALTIQDSGTYYDVLDLKPDASPQEIREGYLRAKSAYNRDSVALYTLISPEETEEMLRKIEEAYLVLSSPERRKDYDKHHGLLSSDELELDQMQARSTRKVVSIDRVPPMEQSESIEHLLNPPKTDFSPRKHVQQPLPDVLAPRSKTPSKQPPAQPQAQMGPAPTHPSAGETDSTLEREIAQEVEWKGPFLKRIRESRRIAIEELADITKITKTYLLAIEDENFAKLPAPVYVRGFVSQVCRALKIPSEKVVTAYLARYYQARPDRAR